MILPRSVTSRRVERDDSDDVDFASVATFFDQLENLMALSPIATNVAAMAAFFDAIVPTTIVVQTHPADALPTLSPADLNEFLAEMAELPAAARMPTPPFNIWDVTGIGRSEVRNTAILAWALNPRGSHDKGADVFNALLAHARKKPTVSTDGFPFPSQISRYSIRTEACPFSDQANRVDIVVDGSDFTIFIEAKIGAVPDADQVRRYLELSKARAAATGRARYGVIFLAPYWARSLPNLGPHVFTITWHDVADAILSCTSPSSSDHSADSALKQFADHIRSF